jgi:FtsP/CotA-like multicopper oxidase with cupredoxin domain
VFYTFSRSNRVTPQARTIAIQNRQRRLISASSLLAIMLFSASSYAQSRSGGHGAMSAQDMQKMVAGPLSSSGTGVCPDLAAGSTVTAPADLYSQNGVLEVTLNLETDVDAVGRQRYCYITSTGLVSPNLRVNPGDTLLIHFYNQLPSGLDPVMPDVMPSMHNMASVSHGSAHSMATGMQVTLHDTTNAASTTSSPCDGGAMTASVSNLHFHGLNVSPTCHSDEVVDTLVQPGQEFDYSVQIPANEPPGLYWYHPHPHGFSEGQVQGGATGAIIVEGIQQANTFLVGLPEQTQVVRDLLVPLSEQNDNNVPAWDLSLDNVPVSFPTYTPSVVPVTPSQQQLWRVLNSAADTILNLQYVIGGTAQVVKVVAIDGVPITGGSVQESSLLLPPGSRVEFVVTTPAIGQTAQLVTQYVNTGPDGDYDPTRPIANIVASTSAPALPVLQAVKSGTSAVAKASVRRFAALPQAAAAASTTPQRTLYFSEQLQDPTDPNSPTTFFITQDGMTPEAYTMGQAPNIVVHSGTVETWVIQNHAMEDHIFHIHQIHFQVLAVNGVAVNDPAIRDTYDLPYWTGQGAYPSITVAMDFRDPNIVGTFVYHCHILQHEDAGMMGTIEVLPAGAGSTAVIATSATTTAPSGNTTLTATIASSVAGGSTPTGQVQFQSNGLDVGNPATVINGVATLSVPGSSFQTGGNSVQAFYMGDTNYAESLSNTTTVTDAPFSITGSGTSAAIGSAASASLNLVLASNYTSAIQLTCAMPASLAEAACFVNPSSVVGGGPVTPTVNTTPVHASLRNSHREVFFPATTGVLSALLLPFVQRKRKLRRLSSMLAVFLCASLLSVIGCSGGGASKTDPGTLAGTYSVTVTATGPSGTTPYTTSIAVPITVQ